MSDKPEPRWDLDYKAGRQAELWVQNLRKSLEEDTIEVKLDRRFPDTGNIYVEYECKRRGSMRPSGIATTTSRLWIQVLVEDELALIISTDRLKEIARQYFRKRKVQEKDGSHPTSGVAVPVLEIIKSAIHRKSRNA